MAAETYVGKLCKRGHDHEGSGGSLRCKSNSECIVCNKQYCEANKEKIAEYDKQYRQRPYVKLAREVDEPISEIHAQLKELQEFGLASF